MVFKLNKIAIKLILKLKITIVRCSIQICTVPGYGLKDLYSTAPKRGSVFIGLMTPDGAIWSRYQRTV